MDSVFEKELLKIQINRLFDLYDENTAKNILIKCIDISFFKKKESTVIKKEIRKDDTSICQICTSTEFYKTKSEEICRQCGNVHRVIYNPTVFKIKNNNEFVGIGDNKLDTIIDGKKVKLDLDKLNLYSLESLTPHQRMYRNGVEFIKDKLNDFNIDYNEDELNSTLKMYWNITLYYDNFKNVKPPIKPQENKRAYQALCVYYGFNKRINIYRIIEAFDTTLKNLEYFNSILKVIFKDTKYEDNLDPSVLETFEFKLSNILLSEKTNDLLEKLIELKLFKEISKETYGATALYVARNIFKMNYSVAQIQRELNIKNTSKLNQFFIKITNFIKLNPKILISS